jgi:hypothetical protein
VDTPEDARHAAHLLQVLGDELEPRPELRAQAGFPKLAAAAPWAVVPSALSMSPVPPRTFDVASDAE